VDSFGLRKGGQGKQEFAKRMLGSYLGFFF
jgi:hypothetical protein